MNKYKQSDRVFRILPDFNPGCMNCSLSNKGAYPAREEVKKGYSLAPNEKRPKIDKPNAGRYLKYSIIHTFDNDPNFPDELKPFYNRVAFTNMIKCSPFNFRHEKMDVTDKHIKSCKITWLEKEIEAISKFNPTCPILLCGSEAVKLLGPKMKVYSNRRQVFTYKTTHPVLVTFNPVEVCRYTSYKIVDKRITSNKTIDTRTILLFKSVVLFLEQ